MKSIVLGAVLALAGAVVAHGDNQHAINIEIDDEENQQAVPVEVADEADETTEVDPLEDFVCEDKYQISVYSRDPLIIYIENFLSPFEREHLQKIS